MGWIRGSTIYQSLLIYTYPAPFCLSTLKFFTLGERNFNLIFELYIENIIYLI